MFDKDKQRKRENRKKTSSERDVSYNYPYAQRLHPINDLTYQLKLSQAVRYPFNRIGIIKGRLVNKNEIITLCNAFLISSRMLLTIFTIINDNKNMQIQHYIDLKFYPLFQEGMRFERGVKITYVDPIKMKSYKKTKNNQNVQNFAVFILAQSMDGHKDQFIKPTICKCKTCLLGKQEKPLSIVGYCQKRQFGRYGNYSSNYTLQGIKDKGRVFEICDQRSQIYFNFQAKQMQRGCPLFVDSKCIGIYLSSRKGYCVGLLFNKEIIQDINAFSVILQKHQINTQQFTSCYHNSLLQDSQEHQDQAARIKLLQNSNSLLNGKIEMSKFIRLQQLYLRGNKIQTVAFGKNNFNIRYLDLSLNCIDRIDLTHLKKLEKLIVSHNQLTQVNVSQNTILVELNLSHNNIKNLYLYCNKMIRILRLQYNQISAIDLSLNIQLVIVYLNHNLLMGIDLHNNQLIKILNLDDNDLQKQISLNLKMLKKFSARNNINLTKIRIRSDKLKQIYVSRFNMPYSLIGDQLSQIDSQGQIQQPNSYEIDYRNRRIKIPKDKIVRLQIQNWCLAYLDIQPYKNIEIMNLNGNRISQIDLACINALRTLSVNDNVLTSLLINKNTYLVYLSANNNKIEHIDIRDNQELKNLYLNSNNLQRIDCSSNGKLQKVKLSSNQLIQANFASNNSLKHLQIENNYMIDLNISGSSKLQTLILGQNYLKEIKIPFNPILLQKIIPQKNAEGNTQLNRQDQEMKIYLTIKQTAEKHNTFLFCITIVAKKSERRLCSRWINKLQLLQNIKYFQKKQSQSSLFQEEDLKYNNFIFKIQIKQD